MPPTPTLLHAARKKIRELERDADRLRCICADVYQVLGVLAAEAGREKDRKMRRVLDVVVRATSEEYPLTRNTKMLPFPMKKAPNAP